MPLPIVYRNSGENTLNSYDFTDIISGVAYQTFYPMNTYQGGGFTYALSVSQAYSQSSYVSVTVPAGTAAFTSLSDIDYDIEFGIPRVIDGEAIINLTDNLSGVVGATKESYIIFKIRKYSGITETELGNATASTSSLTAVSVSRVKTVKISLSKTSFAVGDKLRLTIEVWGKNTDGGNALTVCYGSDPKGRIETPFGASDSTTAYFYCPFVVQL